MEIILLVNAKNFDEFSDKIIASEEVYAPSIRATEEGYKYIFESPDSYAAIILVDGVYAGNYIAYELTIEEKVAYGLPHLDERTIYLENILVTPLYQGKGYAQKLFVHLRERATKAGYTLLAGHFREKASFALALKNGAKMLCPEDDWIGSGERHYFCIIRLSK